MRAVPRRPGRAVPDPRSVTWEQAFSTDRGATWETNWTMSQERID